jgi:hypothetical protein
LVRLKVCPCFRLSEREEFMEPVANRPWDAWHVVNNGKRFSLNYVSDGFYYYLMHLLHSSMCRRLVDISFFTVLTCLSRLYEARRRFFQHVGAEPRRSRYNNSDREYAMKGTIDGGSIIVLKAKALEVSDAKLARFEERLEKLMHGMDRVRNEIRKTKLMILIGFTALIAFQILLRWIRF